MHRGKTAAARRQDPPRAGLGDARADHCRSARTLPQGPAEGRSQDIQFHAHHRVIQGRILDDTLPLLAEAGIVPTENPDKSRKLIIPTTQDDVRLLIVRATDVPTYVEHGAADLGVAGKDVLMEYGGQGLYEPLDLRIARCKLMTAGAVGVPEQGAPARGHQVRQRRQALLRRTGSPGRSDQALRFHGAGPLVGLADKIIDVVDTGNTLRANGLEPQELIATISSRLVVNKASMKMQHARIQALIDTLRQAVESRHHD